MVSKFWSGGQSWWVCWVVHLLGFIQWFRSDFWERKVKGMIQKSAGIWNSPVWLQMFRNEVESLLMQMSVRVEHPKLPRMTGSYSVPPLVLYMVLKEQEYKIWGTWACTWFLSTCSEFQNWQWLSVTQSDGCCWCISWSFPPSPGCCLHCQTSSLSTSGDTSLHPIQRLCVKQKAEVIWPEQIWGSWLF